MGSSRTRPRRPAPVARWCRSSPGTRRSCRNGGSTASRRAPVRGRHGPRRGLPGRGRGRWCRCRSGTCPVPGRWCAGRRRRGPRCGRRAARSSPGTRRPARRTGRSPRRPGPPWPGRAARGPPPGDRRSPGGVRCRGRARRAARQARRGARRSRKARRGAPRGGRRPPRWSGRPGAGPRTRRSCRGPRGPATRVRAAFPGAGFVVRERLRTTRRRRIRSPGSDAGVGRGVPDGSWTSSVIGYRYYKHSVVAAGKPSAPLVRLHELSRPGSAGCSGTAR